MRFIHNYNSNTFLGPGAGNFTTTGIRNVAVGDSALANLGSNGNDNTVIGSPALSANTTGVQNTAIGRVALINNTTGSGNIAVGVAGQNLTTGDNNIDIGNSGVAAESATIRIGTAGTQTRTFIAGIFGVTPGAPAIGVFIDGNGQLATTMSSRRYKFDIADIRETSDGLMRLRPVRFRYRAQGSNAPLQYGLIAEEVAEVYPVTRDKDGQPETVMYQFLAPMLLNEVQKQYQTITEQHRTITEQH